MGIERTEKGRLCGSGNRDAMAAMVRCFLLPLLLMVGVHGCVVNPVTGKRELGLVSFEQEVAIGEQQYVPSQQMQGGAYRADPNLTAYVQSVGKRLGEASGVRLPYEFIVLNNSVPNAWALPGGKIAVNRGLLTALDNEAELAAVLGHEIAHAAARHGARAVERGLVLQGALIAATVGTRSSEYGRAIVGSATLGASLITQKYGRDAEREADEFGTRWMTSAGYDAGAAVTLQETFVKLSGARRQSWLQGLFSSHPPSRERVENNRRHVAELREAFPGGERGERAFRRAMQHLIGKADAYAAYDEGRKAFAEGRFEDAAQNAADAIAIEPNDASLHGLRGDVRLLQKRYADAVTNYDRAILLDDRYFGYFLGRGFARVKQGYPQTAKRDLQASVALLPTANAYNELGKIAESEGAVELALSYYGKAKNSSTAAGREASASAVRIDLPRNPARYLDTEIVQPQGRYALLVRNKTRAVLVRVRVRVALEWADGTLDTFMPTIAQLDASGEALLALPARNSILVGARAEVTSAQLKME